MLSRDREATLVNVKAQALLNAAAYVRERYGADGLGQVLAACAPAVRGDGKFAEEMGAAGARVNLRKLHLRLAFFLARPEFLMRRVVSLWSNYNDEGEMIMRDFAKDHMIAELVGCSNPNFALCCSITGWFHEGGLSTGLKRVVTTHTECRARGALRCIWQLRWSEKDVS
jgi:hypothetical protein